MIYSRRKAFLKKLLEIYTERYKRQGQKASPITRQTISALIRTMKLPNSDSSNLVRLGGFRAKRFVASIDSIETIKFPAAKERRRCIILENCIVLCRPANGRRAISKTFHWRFPFVGCSLAAVQFSQRKICNRISSVKQNGTGRIERIGDNARG